MTAKPKTVYGPVVNGVGSYVLPSGEKRYRVVQKVPGRRKTINKGGFRTKGAAKHWLRETLNKLHDGTHVSGADARKTFGPFAERWLEKYGRDRHQGRQRASADHGCPAPFHAGQPSTPLLRHQAVP